MAAGSGAPTLIPAIGDVFAFLSIASVAGLFYFFGRKSVKDSLVSRKNSISDQLIERQKTLQQMRDEMSLLNQELDGIELEKERIIQKIEDEGKKVARQIIDEARESAERIQEDSKMSANAELKKLHKDLRTYLVEGALNSIKDDISQENSQKKRQETHEALFDKLLNEFPVQLSASEQGSMRQRK